MSRYVLDSTVLIELQASIQPTASRVRELVSADHELCSCAVTLTEYYSGAPRNANPRMDALLDRLSYIDLSPEMAATAGEYRYNAMVRGRRLATPDALVAALTKHTNATLLTNNVRDFRMDIDVEQLGGSN